MKLKKLLLLQCAYFIAGMIYNVWSYALLSSNGAPLAPTAPLMGGASMIIYALFLLPGVFGRITLYRVLMAVAILVMGYGGVVKHVINFFGKLSLYHSVAAWALAVGINLFGLVLNIIAATGRFDERT